MNCLLYNIDDVVDELDSMYAHISKDDDTPSEKLKEHLDLVMRQVYLFNEHNGFFKRVRVLIKDVLNSIDLYENNKDVEDFIFKIFLNAIYLHDIGKCSIGFQYKKMNNHHFKDVYTEDMSTAHSPFSSRIYADIVCEDLEKNLKEFRMSDSLLGSVFLIYIIINFIYCIQTHHSSMVSVREFIMDGLDNIFKCEDEDGNLVFKPSIECSELMKYTKRSDKSKVLLNIKRYMVPLNNITDKISRELLLLNKILYSAMVTADSLATSKYINKIDFEFKSLNIDDIIREYEKTEIIQGIRKHIDTNCYKDTINAVRCDIFKEADERLRNNIDANIFYLESPTGSGKTNMATNCALKCVELTKNNDDYLQKIVYTAPFNTITTQTSEFLNNIFVDKPIVDIAEINSVEPIKRNANEEEDSFDLSLFDYQIMNYDIILTSHVKLFSVLFGNSRIDNHSLIHLFNSVVIIDEIQAYKTDVWSKMISLIDVYAKYMNIKFVIMSATLPKIGALLEQEKCKSKYVSLIKDSSIYFENKYFKERISKYNFMMLEDSFLSYKKNLDFEEYKAKCFEKIINKIRKAYKNNDERKILVEFIKKKTCREFYKYIKKCNSKDFLKDSKLIIREITSEDTSYFKKRVIKEVKDSNSIIVVSTQCIEAGVDISMDMGFKDISYIDNEEQFLGRIAREYCKDKYSEVVFFDLDNEDDVYTRNDYNYKKGLTIMNKKYREILQTKKFSILYNELLESINLKLSSSNDKTGRYKFNNMLSRLDYKDIYDSLELISNKNEYRIFIPYNIHIKEFAHEDIMLSGKDVWAKFSNIFKYKEYSKKTFLMSEVMNEISLFTYKYALKGNMDFESFLKNKGILFEVVKNIYCLKLNDDVIKSLIDDEYKIDYEKFEIMLQS